MTALDYYHGEQIFGDGTAAWYPSEAGRCGIGKTLAAFVRRADEGTLSRLMVEPKHSARSLAVESHHGTPRRSQHGQGGYRSHRRQGQAGVRREG
jgi:hypothetical protein